MQGVMSPKHIKINSLRIPFSPQLSLPTAAIPVSSLLCPLPVDARKAVSRQLQLLD
jgi:hypothetical protein